jgi:glycosyltransferase involved in cell wall biosynthesis
MRLLHAIHDFLPRHAAGSEIYAFRLCHELAARHVVHVVAAEYDPARLHGTLAWRVHEGLPVIELVNNWEGSFADTWRSPRLGQQLNHVLRALQPDVLHLHSLLNLTFDLPIMARAHGIPVVATLHDYTLVCPAGGQRLHSRDRTICADIQPARCAECFSQSPFHSQMAVGAATRIAGPGGRRVGRAASWAARRAPRTAALFARHALAHTALVTKSDIAARLDYLRRVFDSVDLFVAPSAALASAYVEVGLPAEKVQVSDYGFVARPLRPHPRFRREVPLRIGFAGTLVWHKGVHVLVEAMRSLPPDRCELEIWGSLDTFPGYTAELKARARGLPVRFCGQFDHSDAASVYDRFDVLVVPSIWPENSPLVIHEAFMAGIPVVASRIGGIPELVADGVNGLLYEPTSPASLAAALATLLDNPHRIAEMAERVPPVKTIEEDAREWERRYEELRDSYRVHSGGRN